MKKRLPILMTTVLSGATVTYSISGVVYDADGSTPVSGATVALGSKSGISTGDGTYTITGVPAGASGSMTCTLAKYRFTAISVSAMSEDLTSQNYTANNYAAVLQSIYGASEVFPLVDIASGTTISARVTSARNGVLQGWDLQNAAGPVTDTLAPYSDGANDFGNIYTASLNSIFNGGVGWVSVCWKVSAAGDWTDATERRFVSAAVDGNNYLRLYKSNTDNRISMVMRMGGDTAQSVNLAISDTGWNQSVVTWNTGSRIEFYNNGVSQKEVAIAGTWAGSLASDSTNIGASTTVPADVWKGWIAYVAFGFGTALSDAQALAMYQALATAGADP